MNLRAGDALHDRIRPPDVAFGRNGDDRFLHRVKNCSKFLSAALKLGKIPAQPLSGRLSAASMAENSSLPPSDDAGLKSPSASRRTKEITSSSRAEMRLADPHGDGE